MAVTHAKAKKSPKTKSETEIVGEATRRLLKGIKEHAKSKGKTLKRDELLARGYNEKFIDKLEAA
jgi:hypothetical protein